jgi:Ca2+-binding EF-hand superfamily protein
LKEILSDEKVQIPDDEIDKLIAEADLNHDNQIDYDEFLEMMKKDLKEKL